MLGVFVPSQVGNTGLQAGVVVQIVMAGNAFAVLENFRRKGIFVLRHVVQFFQQRQITVGLHIAHGAGITIPIPRATKVARFFDHANVVESRLFHARGH